jgi:hypothetical protein
MQRWQSSSKANHKVSAARCAAVLKARRRPVSLARSIHLIGNLSGNLSLTHLKNVHQAQINIRSDRNRYICSAVAGQREGDEAIIHHAVFRCKPLERSDPHILHRAKHLAVIIAYRLFAAKYEPAWGGPYTILSVYSSNAFIDFIICFAAAVIAKTGFTLRRQCPPERHPQSFSVLPAPPAALRTCPAFAGNHPEKPPTLQR